MKKRIFSILAVFTGVALLLIACKSTPDSADALTEAKAKADESRKRAMDFEAPAYFPSEWEAVEAQYAAAGALPAEKAAEIQVAAEAYNAVAKQYDAIFEKAVPLYAQAREDELMAKREELIATGFTQYFPDYLQNADALALSAKEQFEAKDYYKAKDTAAKAMEEYDTLLAGSKVFLARQEVIDRGFRQYDADNFDKADEVVKSAISDYEAGKRDAALTSAEEALLRYNIVLANGWTIYASERRASAAKERELALEEKVNIASREAFRDADSQFTQAEENFKDEKFADAAILYTDSEARFAIARKDTEERRQRAEEAIKLAEEKIEESNVTATEAERIIEGVSR